MRSLFWRVLAAFWLALAMVAGLSLLLGHALNNDAWIIARHPGMRHLAAHWTELHESGQDEAAQALLDRQRHDYHLFVQVQDENGQRLSESTVKPHRPPSEPSPHFDRHPPRFPGRQLSQEYHSPGSDQNYLFIYRIPHGELLKWRQDSLLWPISALLIALVVLTLFSLLLTLSITRPLNRLRSAVHDLGRTRYQRDSLTRLSNRRDELGTLARDFNRMGARLQDLIDSQRQLLRDVSHELRSPLARLRIALALAERADASERARLWPRLILECDRLEALIGEILALARLDNEPGAARPVDLGELIERLRRDSALSAPGQEIHCDVQPGLTLSGWPDMLERALDNLLRNALRFSPPGQPVEIRARSDGQRLRLSVRDHGPGVVPEHLARLGEPFYRAPDQSTQGHGLGLAIARRAAERHDGRLELANPPDGGFVATLDLPLTHPLSA